MRNQNSTVTARIVALCTMLVFAGSAIATAQQQAPEVSDSELQLFVDASLKAQDIQTEAQMQMITIVQNEGLEVGIYNEIFQSLEQGQALGEIEAEPEDIERFEKAYEQIGEIEQQLEDSLITAIEDEGLELERYQEIFMAIQSSSDLQEKMQEMIREAQIQRAMENEDQQ